MTDAINKAESIATSTVYCDIIILNNADLVFYNPTFNPIDNIINLYERLHKEKTQS